MRTLTTCQDDIKSFMRSWSTSRYSKVRIQRRRNCLFRSHSFKTRSSYEFYQSESHSKLNYVDQPKRSSELREVC